MSMSKFVAILSVSEKTGVIDLGKALTKLE